MIDAKKLTSIANLARLHMTDQEAQVFAEQLSKALHYFEQIKDVPTQNIEPLVTPVEMKMVLREDVSEQKYSVEEMTENAPAKTGHLFTVPPVV